MTALLRWLSRNPLWGLILALGAALGVASARRRAAQRRAAQMAADVTRLRAMADARQRQRGIDEARILAEREGAIAETKAEEAKQHEREAADAAKEREGILEKWNDDTADTNGTKP